MQPGNDGVSLTTIIATARVYGVHLEAWRLHTGALDTLTVPAILWVDKDHFVVFDSLTTAGIYLRDPATGRVRTSRKSLTARWDGTAAVPLHSP
jgi:ABC-type bacteriocin/lantibiotic exporter with double-glycine peptidase domain